jgi:predicted TIM-barrel fold metal-dependent hydrolase
MEHADRILFGLDDPSSDELYRTYYRFLETADEYFDYGVGERPGQGRWHIYGIDLPQDVLEKVYRTNAERIFHLEAFR